MGRFATYPDELERLKSISIADLKKLGYLKPETSSGKRSINWTRDGENTGTIGVLVQMNKTDGTITFDYTYRGTQNISYEVQIISRPSNLGKGLNWFFVCPKTQKVCRKLTLYGGYFLHRTAFKLFYEKQLQSKKMRYYAQTFGLGLDDSVYYELHKKHFKSHYRGRPTKKFIRLEKILTKKENINIQDLYRFLSPKR